MATLSSMDLLRLNWRARLVVIGLLLLTTLGLSLFYTRKVEQFLLHGQQNALLLIAGGIATILHERQELFAPATGVPAVLGRARQRHAFRLDGPIQLNGDFDDWGDWADQASLHTGDANFSCEADDDPESFTLHHLLGYREGFLYALFAVRDERLVWRDPEHLRLDMSDQIRILLRRPGGGLAHYLLIAEGPGRMSAYLVDETWQNPVSGEPIADLVAELVPTAEGYRVELRLPIRLTGRTPQVGLWVVDVDDPEEREIRRIIATTPGLTGAGRVGEIFLHSPELQRILQALDRPQARIWILDNSRRVRAVVGGLDSEPLARELWFTRWLDWLLGRPPETFEDIPSGTAERLEDEFLPVLKGEPRIWTRPSQDRQVQLLVASHPIHAGEEILGAVVVEQRNEAVLSSEYRFLRGLTLANGLAFLGIFALLLGFAWNLAERVRRLCAATDEAITPHGRVIETMIPNPPHPADELGELRRTIGAMLKRLAGHTRYLEGLPDTLAHELNNPLNVVGSSLDILSQKLPSARDNKYMDRARNGLDRLRGILHRLTEAASLEEAMHSEVLEPLDFGELLAEVIGGYRSAYPENAITLTRPERPLIIRGSADHLAQLLDKLIDNAVQFSTPGEPIEVCLRGREEEGCLLLEIGNTGPPLDDQLRERLFDPMVSARRGDARNVHLGLGLFVARLIVDYHRGSAWLENRPETADQAAGVTAFVRLPLDYSA